jgi:hypothetical protein
MSQMTEQPTSWLQWEKRAKALASLFQELSRLPPSVAAEELNRRGVKALAGDKWRAEQVVRVRRRLKATGLRK